jgi:ABC-type proline/glycine betaine transport system permease subunit
MRFDATGETTGLLPRHFIFYLPAVSLAVAAVNLVLGLLAYRWERLASRVLQAATLIAQLLFALAVLAIIT